MQILLELIKARLELADKEREYVRAESYLARCKKQYDSAYIAAANGCDLLQDEIKEKYIKYLNNTYKIKYNRVNLGQVDISIEVIDIVISP